MEFDIETGKRVVSKSDILSGTIHENITLGELIDELAKQVHPDDKAIMQEYDDVKKIMQDLLSSKRKISVDYRSRAPFGGYDGYRWALHICMRYLMRKDINMC